jgi:antitoxin (DNA-binding transcriptional repressor) of toxin-antitoxin stability system
MMDRKRTHTKETDMSTITVQEAQVQLPDLIHRLFPGEEVILTENNQPVAKLVATAPPSQPRPTPKLGTQRGSVLSMEHFDDPLEEFEEYR